MEMLYAINPEIVYNHHSNKRCRQPSCSNLVMGGSNYSRQSYCENCLLIWDGDD